MLHVIFRIQAHLRDISGLVLNHHILADTAIKSVKSTFGLSVYKEVMFTPQWSP